VVGVQMRDVDAVNLFAEIAVVDTELFKGELSVGTAVDQQLLA